MLAAQKSVRDAFDHVVVHCADDHVRGKDGDTSTTTKTTNNRGAGASSWWATILGLRAGRWNPLQKNKGVCSHRREENVGRVTNRRVRQAL